MTEKKANSPRRRSTQLRPIRITRQFTDFAPGSVLFEMGRTRILCTASFVNELPKWRRESELGWLTAEYSMLPSSTTTRKSRPRSGHTDSRGTEIQRLIGRVLRTALDFEKLGPNSINIDCDVLQADGGTRTAAINGAYVALIDAVHFGLNKGLIGVNPIKHAVAAVSVGIIKGKPVLDLDYELDSAADVDMNIAMNDKGHFLEIQGSAEQASFSRDQFDKIITYAQRGIKKILIEQKNSLG